MVRVRKKKNIGETAADLLQSETWVRNWLVRYGGGGGEGAQNNEVQ